MSEPLPRPLSYRAELLSRVMPSLRAGECCSLVGVSGVGKSNLVRFLHRRDVQNAYWNTDSAWVVLIDANSLMFGEQSLEYIVFELMIHRLIMEAESRSLPVQIASWASDLHAHLVTQPSAHLAFRYLERLCARLCEANGIQIIFAFDQFEDLWQTAEARFFLNLRSLRDQFKYQMVYLVITRDLLERSREDIHSVESFWELFTSHIYGLGMYSDDDACIMLKRLAERRSIPLDSTLQRLTIRAGGRHPGLMRALFWELCDSSTVEQDDAKLLALPSVAAECDKIWNDFTPDEQRLALTIASGQAPRDGDNPTLRMLLLKQIVFGNPPAIFSPLFSIFVVRRGGSDMSGVVVAPGTRRVWVDGQPIEKPLARLEFALLAYLARHVGTVCPREDIMREIYKDRVYSVNDERLDTILRRLREALGEDARNPRYLVTHRGAGVQLTHGRVRE